jgi:hypothetical protein
MPVEHISETSIEELNKLFERYPGDIKIRVKLIDLSQGIAIGLNSTNKKIELNNDFLRELDNMHVKYNLN